jgi:hypothetical protein
MKIDVYDTYLKGRNGELVHFDVFVPMDTPKEKAFKAAKTWLSSVDLNANDLKQDLCAFCHSEIANPEVHRVIEREGFYILQMEGCPEQAQKA